VAKVAKVARVARVAKEEKVAKVTEKTRKKQGRRKKFPDEHERHIELTHHRMRDMLLRRYNKYHQYWINSTHLNTVLAMLGLGLAITNWELSFEQREVDGQLVKPQTNILDIIVLVTTLLSILTVFIKEYCAVVWYDYRNPLAFYHSIIREQHKRGQKVRGHVLDSV
jgi:hypothetical protein